MSLGLRAYGSLVGEFRFLCYPYRVRESLSGCWVSVAACLAVALALVGLAVQVESQGSLWTEVDAMLFILLVGVALDSTEPAQGLSQYCSKIFLVWIGRRLRVPPPPQTCNPNYSKKGPYKAYLTDPIVWRNPIRTGPNIQVVRYSSNRRREFQDGLFNL